MPKELMESNDYGRIGTVLFVLIGYLDRIDPSMVTLGLGWLVAIFTVSYYIIKIYSELLTIKKKKKEK